MTIEEHLARAAQAQQQGRRADVVREAEAALRLRNDHPIAHNMLGMEALARRGARACPERIIVIEDDAGAGAAGPAKQ